MISDETSALDADTSSDIDVDEVAAQHLLNVKTQDAGQSRFGMDSRTTQRNHSRKRKVGIAAGAVVASIVATTAVALLLRASSSVADSGSDSAMVVSLAMGDCGSAFKQCGGKGFTGTTCCQAGCTCMPSSDEYYYQCQPAGHSGQCDPSAAKSSAETIMEDTSSTQAEAVDAAVAALNATKKAMIAAKKLLEAEESAVNAAQKEVEAAKMAGAAVKARAPEKWAGAVASSKKSYDNAEHASKHVAGTMYSLKLAEEERVNASKLALAKFTRVKDPAKKAFIWAENVAVA